MSVPAQAALMTIFHVATMGAGMGAPAAYTTNFNVAAVPSPDKAAPVTQLRQDTDKVSVKADAELKAVKATLKEVKDQGGEKPAAAAKTAVAATPAIAPVNAGPSLFATAAVPDKTAKRDRDRMARQESLFAGGSAPVAGTNEFYMRAATQAGNTFGAPRDIKALRDSGLYDGIGMRASLAREGNPTRMNIDPVKMQRPLEAIEASLMRTKSQVAKVDAALDLRQQNGVIATADNKTFNPAVMTAAANGPVKLNGRAAFGAGLTS